jgi:hypothetical protein
MQRRALHAGAAAVIAATALGFGSVPADARAPAITLTSPDLTKPVGSPAVHIAGQAAMPSGGSVTGSIVIQVTSPEGHPGGETSIPAGRNPADFGWDFNSAYNGVYHLHITATGRDGSIDASPNEQAVYDADFSVEAKPTAPSGLSAKANRDRVVELKWTPNSEPDLIGYQVQRSTSAKTTWTAVANTADAAYTDSGTADEGGTYRYRVVAVRQGAAANAGVASDPSETRSVDVASPPSTPSTTVNGPGGTGGPIGGPGGPGGSGGPGGRAGSGGTDTSPELARTGKVDLSGFAALLQQARRPDAKPQEADSGFKSTLPFKEGEDGEIGEDGTALGVGIHEAGESEGSRQPIVFVAASLLVTVILMHLLWLKREVEKAPLPSADVATAE